MDKVLEAILMEADKLKIDASPEKMNQSRKEIRRTQDYTVNDDEEVDADDSNQDDPQEDVDTGGTDYTSNMPEDDSDSQENQEDEQQDEEPQEDNEEEDQAAEEPEEQEEEPEEPEEEEPTDDVGDEDASMDDEGTADEAGEGGGTDYTDMDAEDVGGDEGSDDMGGDTGDDTGADDTSSDTEDGTGSEPESDEQVNERHRKTKQLTLMNQMIGLHTNINSYIEQLNGVERTNVFVSSIISTVSDNFNKLKEVIYKYIMYYFNNMSYEYNLYTFNYFIEAIKVNIELLAKIKDAQNYDSETSK